MHLPARPPSTKNTSTRTDKRFTCRDGFHLKDRNDGRRAAIDQQLFPQPADTSVTDQSNPSFGNNADEAEKDRSTKRESTPDDTLSSFDCERIAIANLLQRAAASKYLENDYSEVVIGKNDLDEKQQAKENKPEIPEGPTIVYPHTIGTKSKFKPYAEWLIYRPRDSMTPRRKQQQMEVEIQNVLSAVTESGKANELLIPAPPERKAIRKSRGLATRPNHRILSPLAQADTERSLLSSRESSNRDVDRLLVELFQVPSTDTDSCAAATMLGKRTKLRFATRRSELREQSAMALRQRNLQSRMDELRSVPQVLDRVLEMARIKQQNLVKAHGENLILKNKKHTYRLLQMPPQTPMYPSRAEQKQHQALQRKQVLDENQEIAVRGAVNRWQNRRLEHKRQAQQRYRECQWLLLVQLAHATTQWCNKFQKLKEKHDFMLHISMAKKIQRIWRQHVLLRSNSLSLFRMASSRSIRSPFYRMPIVMKGVCLLQKAMRRWLEQKRNQVNRRAVDMIITAWFEFQDVKFRRLILRFRKRVRDFQIMWRTWRSITDARIKLLLLVWAKMEKKAKRRYGVLSASSVGDDSEAMAADASRSMSLVHVLRNKVKEPKHKEGIHRHLRNGGTVLTPVSVGSPSPKMANVVAAFSPCSLSPTTLGLLSSPTKARIANKVRHHKELKMQMQDEFHVAMQDFYATRNTLNHHSNASGSQPEASPAPLINVASPHSPIRRAPTSPRKFLLSVFAATHVAPTQHTTEKIPLSVRVSLLRQLISDKRRAFRARKEKNRYVAWSLGRAILMQSAAIAFVESNGRIDVSTCGAWSSATMCWRNWLRITSSAPTTQSSFCCTTCPSSRCFKSCSTRSSKLPQVQPTRASRSHFPRPVILQGLRCFRLPGLWMDVDLQCWVMAALGCVQS